MNKIQGRLSVVKATKGFWFHGNMRNLDAFWNPCFIIHGESPCCCRCRTETLYVSHCGPADSHRQAPRETTSSSAGVKARDSANMLPRLFRLSGEAPTPRSRFRWETSVKNPTVLQPSGWLRSQSWCCVKITVTEFQSSQQVHDASEKKSRFWLDASVSPYCHHVTIMSVVHFVLHVDWFLVQLWI